MPERVHTVSGDVAFACGAVASGVSLVTGYPGSPSSGTIEALLRMPESEAMQVTWATNECIAMEMVMGASIAGRRALLCVKSVGLNVALDPLMTLMLAGSRAGLVILLGDDPGGWASQNEQDSRLLALFGNIPLLEPSTPQEAQDMLIEAFDLSERFTIPVIVRETRALALTKGPVQRAAPRGVLRYPYAREPNKWLSWPGNVVSNHRALHAKLEAIRAEFETSRWNRVQGTGRLGIVACGVAYAKLQETLGTEILDRFRLLKLSTFNPLPVESASRFLAQVDRVLVFEDNEPYLEQALQAVAQRRECAVPVLGRLSGHLPIGGELDANQITDAMTAFQPALASELDEPEAYSRAMPSQTPFCSDCPYVPLFEALLACVDDSGGRDSSIIVGEPSCMVKACSPPYELLDVKYSLGSSIGMAVGLAMAKPGPRVIALAGDSSLLHHSWGALVEAVRNDVDLLVIVLDNSTTAMSGRQPHAATTYNARRVAATPVDLEKLIRASGATQVWVIDPLDNGQTQQALHEALHGRGLEVIISRSPCTLIAHSEAQ